MDRIEVKDEKTRQWEPGQYDLRFRREIVTIEGDRLTLDAPMVQAIEADFGGGSVTRYRDPGRIERVGVEHLRAANSMIRLRTGGVKGNTRTRTTGGI